MAEFSYRLVVLTHASAGGTLRAALDSFEANAAPAPAQVVVVVDGPEFGYASEALGDRWGDADVSVWPGPRQLGFCDATRRAWGHGADGPGPLHVFYLEHDFVITRPVDVAAMVAVLDGNEHVAQMALMRDAVNAQEISAGGLFESRRGQYEPRRLRFHRSGDSGGMHVDRPGDSIIVGPDETTTHEWLEWLEHRSYFTTNPSLMRRSFMQQHPWPEYTDECEGRFGIDLVHADLTFGVWGTGEPWCRHVGTRDGFGY